MRSAGGVRGNVELLNIVERKMIIKAMRTNIGMCKASPLLLAALSVAVGGCSGSKNNGSAASATLAASTFSSSSAIQGSATIIALDPVNQAIWVPSYTSDANGNLQYELIGTAAAVAGGTAAVSKKVSMAGCDTPIGIAYASGISAFLVECGNSGTLALSLSAVNASSLAVTPLATPGLSWNGNYGGIVYDPQHNQAFVAGSQNVGLLQVPASGTPSFDANSVTALPSGSAVSMTMDFTTQQVIVADPSSTQPYVIDASTVNTSAPALNITQLQPLSGPNGAISFQGAAFDSSTDVLALSGDSPGASFSSDVIGALNMATYNPSSLSTNSVVVNGFLDYYIGPSNENNYQVLNSAGGLAALNAATHQVLVGDAWGPNLMLIQLPSTAPGPNGVLDNNGQPTITNVGTANGAPGRTPPDANSAYAIAQALVSPETTGTPGQFNALGNPPALLIDQVNNIAYVLADNSLAPHAWTANSGVTLALASIDLSAPVYGACSGVENCVATWNPLTAQAVVP